MKNWNLKIDGKLAILTLNSEIRGNRLTPIVFSELDAALSKIEISKTRGLIIVAKGPHFSQGFDLRFLLESIEKDLEETERIFSICNKALDKLYHLPIPTMSLINGACIGGGLLIALLTDFRAAHSQAKFGFPEVKQSLIVNLGLKRIYHLLGEYRTKELVLLGRPISSKKLEEWGAINWIDDDPTFKNQIEFFKKHIATTPPLALSGNKELIQKLTGLSAIQSTDFENKLQIKMFQSLDFKESIQSYLEKRKPQYKGE